MIYKNYAFLFLFSIYTKMYMVIAILIYFNACNSNLHVWALTSNSYDLSFYFHTSCKITGTTNGLLFGKIVHGGIYSQICPMWPFKRTLQGRIQDLKLGGGALKKNRDERREARKFLGIFRVKKSRFYAPLNPPLHWNGVTQDRRSLNTALFNIKYTVKRI